MTMVRLGLGGVLLLSACSREPAAPRTQGSASTSSTVASMREAPAPSTSTARPNVDELCRPSNPSMVKFWRRLTAKELDELVKGHVAGEAQPEAGCALSAFMSGVNVFSYKASEPMLRAMESAWKGGDTGKPPAPFAGELREVMPRVGAPTPVLEEKFEDGQGNFMTRKLYRTSDGRFVLVLDYAG